MSNNVGLNGKGVGVPVKLMHESEGHVVTVRFFLSFCLSLLLGHVLFPIEFLFSIEGENWKRKI